LARETADLPTAVKRYREAVLLQPQQPLFAFKLRLARYTPALGRVRVMSGPSETPTLHQLGDLRGTVCGSTGCSCRFVTP
jgi:hypothetical protein